MTALAITRMSLRYWSDRRQKGVWVRPETARSLLATADPVWSADRVTSGLSSGEGLIHELRDVAGEDAGATDKRLLVVESEFATVLKHIERQGNTLSPVLRDGWDGRNLRTLTKNSPGKATEPHLSVIGHVTREQLERLLTATESANGFANRFLYVWVERSKLLPDGGEVNAAELGRLAAVFKQAASSSLAGRIKWDGPARARWHAEYEAMSADRPGLAGSLTARAEAHTVRLALVYALLDRSPVITGTHSRAALAVWRYCAATVTHVYGEQLGDPMADTLLNALRQSPAGLTRTEMSKLLGRNVPADRIEAALSPLRGCGLARPDPPQPTGGRPVERWRAC